MDIKKSVKYFVVAGLIGALLFTPATKAIAAVSGESESEAEIRTISLEEQAEQARQAMVNRQLDEFLAEATSTVNQTVAGTKSQVNGLYAAKGVQGVAMAPSTDSGSDKNSYVKVTDTDKKKSSAAVAVANTVAATLSPNAVVGPCINVEYGKMENGKFTESTSGSKGELSIGVPAGFRSEGAKYAVVAVYGGGAFDCYENTSTDPNKVTVNVGEAKSANVMYALVKY